MVGVVASLVRVHDSFSVRRRRWQLRHRFTISVFARSAFQGLKCLYIYAGVFSDWLCRLTPVLVDALVEDEVLRECKAICALKPDFAAVVSEAEMIFDMVPDGLLSRSHLIQENGIRYTTHRSFDCRMSLVAGVPILRARCGAQRQLTSTRRQFVPTILRLLLSLDLLFLRHQHA